MSDARAATAASLLALLVVLALAGCAGAAWPSGERMLMGTIFRVTVVADDTTAARGAIDACFELFAHVDSTMSEHKARSALSAVNRAAGGAPVAVPRDLLDVLRVSREVAAQSDGAFDPTWAALAPLWPFDGSERVPADSAVARAVERVGWRDLALDESAGTARLARPGMALGLGGIAKGYALDVAAGELRRRGFENFLLFAGGQVLASGTKDGGRAWRVGVQDPRGDMNDFFASLDVGNESISTGGDYEHAFVKDGTRYHHILDPHTGHPVRTVRSVTVIAPNGILADAYDTAAFVLGPEKGLVLAREVGVEIIIIDATGKLHMSDGMRERLSFHRLPKSEEVGAATEEAGDATARDAAPGAR